MRTYYAESGDFSNRFTVAAFSSRAARDRWVDTQKHPARAITRATARKMLGTGYLSPGDRDMRRSLGCYVGSREPFSDELRETDAKDAAMYVDTDELGICDPPVRL